MPKYSDDYRVRVGDADSRGMLKLPSLLGMLQEAAKDHAEALGIGASALLPMDLGWALSKLHLNIERLPSCGERVFVKTWPSVRTRISTEREFVLSDEMGDRVATARTLWVLFDVKKRRLERLDRLGEWPRSEDFADAFRFSKMPPAPSENSMQVSNFGVRKDDIDMNGHVNNSVYLAWALEPLPDEFCGSRRAASLELWFLSEVFRGQRLDSVCEIDGDISRHMVVSEGRERVRAQIGWIRA